MLPEGLSIFIKHRRQELELTQKEFAERYGLSIRALRSLEQGNYNVLLTSALEILNALGYELVPGDFVYKKPDSLLRPQLSLQSIIDRLRTYKPTLEKRFAVDKVAVFGSIARNEQEVDSDIDLLVEFKRKASLKDEAALLEYIKRILDSSRIDLVRIDRLSLDFYKSIEKDLKYA